MILMSGSPNASNQATPIIGTGAHSQHFDVSLRRRNEPGRCCRLGAAAEDVLHTFNRVITEGKSEALLLWPLGIEGAAVFHALAVLTKISICDQQRLVTLFFPWNRNAGGTQRTLLVDRDQIVRAALKPLNRVHERDYRDPASGFLMALHSLKHLSTGEDGNRRQQAIARDPGLMHPTLFEIVPQAGIHSSDIPVRQYEFLQRLRRYTWIKERDEYVNAASDASKTPFFLFGVHPDAVTVEQLRNAGLSPERGGRRPDIVLLDLTRRARNALGGNWRDPVVRLCGVVEKLYGQASPPVLAVTDDIFAMQTLRWKILSEYDVRRGVSKDRRPVPSRLILNSTSDVVDSDTPAPGSLDDLSVEVFGADLLNFVDQGLKLRRALLNAGDQEVASSVAAALAALQNLMALPGAPREFLTFLAENHHGHELQNVGSRFDHLTPRGKISSVLKLGSAGTNHAALTDFLQAFDKLYSEAEAHNPGARIFDDCLARCAKHSTRSVIAFPTDLIRAFAEWRVEKEVSLAAIKERLGEDIIFADNREAREQLADGSDTQTRCEQILFVEPFPDQFLALITSPHFPKTFTVLCHLARAKQILERTEVLLQLDGIAPVEWNLLLVQEQFQKAITGHGTEIPDLDSIMLPPHIGTIDLTGPHSQGSGPTRIIRTSGDVQVRAFDGTELAAYDPDALQPFSRCLAKDLQLGDQICVFSPDFVEAAREKLHISATAPDVLTLYHKTVAEAALKLPGYDLTAKADELRKRMLKIDASLSLPGPQSLRQWISVGNLVDTPRDEVRPQAPRDRRHYLCFMKALGIAEDVARSYWDFGVFWTRSMRIKSGSAFHQVFMSVLVDPYGAAARFSEAHRQEVWRIYETAEQHVVTVTSNDPEGDVR